MGKTGRNDPCPCGSGKKYKRCCISMEPVATGVAEGPPGPELEWPIPPEDRDLSGPPGRSLSPRVLAGTVEEAGAAAVVRRPARRLAERYWTPRKVAALTTEAIQDQLHKLGVDPSREAFIALAADRTSAWAIAEAWVHAIEHPPTGRDEEFLGPAACELWKRLVPEQPSVEMIDEWIVEGYDLSDSDQLPEACDHWWAAWEVIRGRLTPAIRTTEGAASTY